MWYRIIYTSIRCFTSGGLVYQILNGWVILPWVTDFRCTFIESTIWFEKLYRTQTPVTQLTHLKGREIVIVDGIDYHIPITLHGYKQVAKWLLPRLHTLFALNFFMSCPIKKIVGTYIDIDNQNKISYKFLQIQ